MIRLRKFIILAAIVFTLLLVGCKKKQNDSQPCQHVYETDWVIEQNPTIDETGLKTKKCTKCDNKIQETIPLLSIEEYMEIQLEDFSIITETKENIDLPKSYNSFSIKWSSLTPNIITNSGIISREGINKLGKLEATFEFRDVEIVYVYNVNVLGYSNEEKLEMAFSKINFPTLIESDLVLETEFLYNVEVEYVSLNPEIVTNDGKVKLSKEEKQVQFKVIMKLGEDTMEKVYNLNIGTAEVENAHQIIINSIDTNSTKYENVELVNNKLVLLSAALTGSYESDIIETKEFVSLVASWAATSSTTSTVELMVKVRVNGVWSDYITYSPWGLGLQNASHDQSNSLMKLSTDEVKILNSKKADAIIYKVILNRTTLTVESPKLSLVTFALEIPNYNFYVDISGLPDRVCHDVPKLNQNVVPTIGNSICSATSTTMLLKYKGMNFSAYDPLYEHRYIAGIVRDYGNQIYGNWVYNTVAMGAYGYDAYVARMYSINELVYHLATVGPVALSVKGKMTSDVTSYNTNGHLIVAIGYEYINNKLYIICNDPNVSKVECRYSLEVMQDTWRYIAYIIK